MTKDSTKEVKDGVVRMHKEGYKGQEIAKVVGYAKSTVNQIIQRAKKRGTTERPMPLTKPHSLSDRDTRVLMRNVKKARDTPLQDITNSLPTKVSTSTVRKTLHSWNILSGMSVRKPFLTDKHVARRLEFARKHKDWTVEQWRKVIWTDESTFEVGKNPRHRRVWREPSEKYNKDCLEPTFKSGRTSITVWCAFADDQKAGPTIIPAKQRTSQDFVKITYEGHLKGFMDRMPDYILMEDGAPIHTIHVAKEWRESHKIQKINWPPCSPDLHPIENIWFSMKAAVNKRNLRPKNAKQMTQAVLEEWKAIPVERLQELIATMPQRMQDVIKAKSGHTMVIPSVVSIPASIAPILSSTIAQHVINQSVKIQSV
jgi:transposase